MTPNGKRSWSASVATTKKHLNTSRSNAQPSARSFSSTNWRISPWTEWVHVRSEHDEALLECTGADQETHFWSWSGAQDLCFDGMVEAAIDASNAQTMIEVIKDKIKVAAALQDSRENEIKADLEKADA